MLVEQGVKWRGRHDHCNLTGGAGDGKEKSEMAGQALLIQLQWIAVLRRLTAADNLIVGRKDGGARKRHIN